LKNKWEIQHFYNRKMNLVDKFDQTWDSYTTYSKTRRWWVRVFCFYMDIAGVCTMHLWNAVNPDQTLTHKQVILQLVDALLSFRLSSRSCSYNAVEERKEKKKRRKRGRPAPGPGHEDTNHHGWCTRKTYRLACKYCSGRGVRSDTFWACSVCGEHLHPDCMEPYHTGSPPPPPP